MVEFTVHVEMPERWVPYFGSFLKHMEYNGRIGHSSQLSFYADGDGDFRPKFHFDFPFEKVEGIPEKKISRKAEYMYDAG